MDSTTTQMAHDPLKPEENNATPCPQCPTHSNQVPENVESLNTTLQAINIELHSINTNLGRHIEEGKPTSIHSWWKNYLTAIIAISTLGTATTFAVSFTEIWNQPWKTTLGAGWVQENLEFTLLCDTASCSLSPTWSSQV